MLLPISLDTISSWLPCYLAIVNFCWNCFYFMQRCWSFVWLQVVEAINIKMELADKAVGFLLSYISLSVFTYYTFWVIILPFVNSDHFIHRYFLPQEYAILIPVFAGMVLLCFLCIFIGYVMLKSKKKKAWCIYLPFFDILEMNCWNTTFCRDFVNGPSLHVGQIIANSLF